MNTKGPCPWAFLSPSYPNIQLICAHTHMIPLMTNSCTWPLEKISPKYCAHVSFHCVGCIYRQFLPSAFGHPISATERTKLLYCPSCGVQNFYLHSVLKSLNLYFSFPARDQTLCIGPYKNEPCAQLSLLGHVSGSGGVAYLPWLNVLVTTAWLILWLMMDVLANRHKSSWEHTE
jgi:hypothetical protein